MLRRIVFPISVSLLAASITFGQIVLKDPPCKPGQTSSVDLADLKQRAEKADAKAQWQYGLVFFLGCNGIPADHEQAAVWWRLAAGQNQPAAMVDLGQSLLHGDSVAKDVSEAMRLFQKAGELGEPRGYYQLAHMYAIGDGVQQNLSEEAKWYRKLAEQGVPDAMWMMGKYYDEGHGVPEDEEQAKYWWRKAAAAGHQMAATALAQLEAQEGGEDAAKAAEELRKKAKKGDGEAAFDLAEVYLSGKGVPRNAVEATHWFEVAAENNYGRIEVANRLWRGKGVPADPARAFCWYQKVGCEWAGYQLGRMYELGQGTAQDYAKAADCYRTGMERATNSRLGLADLMEAGKGVPKDEAKALDLYREAAEREIGGVAFEIALNFDLGRGLPNDLTQAAQWWKISASYYNGGAALNLAKKYASGSGVPRSAIGAYVWTALGADVFYSAKSANEQLRQQLPQDMVKQGNEVVEGFQDRKKQFGAFYDDSNPVLKMSEAEMKVASSQGNIDALFSLAYRLSTGQGLTADVPESIRLYREVVFQARGDLYANLAKEYELGIVRAKDMKVAIDLYRKAAEAGSGDAQYRLGLAYQVGDGVDKDSMESLKWFLLAADSNPSAKAKAEELQGTLSALQVDAASRNASEIRMIYAR